MINKKFWPEIVIIALNLLMRCKVRICKGKDNCEDCEFFNDEKCEFAKLLDKVNAEKIKPISRLEAAMMKYNITITTLAEVASVAPSSISYCIRYSVRSSRSAQKYAEAISTITGEDIDWRDLLGYHDVNKIRRKYETE